MDSLVQPPTATVIFIVSTLTVAVWAAIWFSFFGMPNRNPLFSDDEISAVPSHQGRLAMKKANSLAAQLRKTMIRTFGRSMIESAGHAGSQVTALYLLVRESGPWAGPRSLDKERDFGRLAVELPPSALVTPYHVDLVPLFESLRGDTLRLRGFLLWRYNNAALRAGLDTLQSRWQTGRANPFQALNKAVPFLGDFFASADSELQRSFKQDGERIRIQNGKATQVAKLLSSQLPKSEWSTVGQLFERPVQDGWGPVTEEFIQKKSSEDNESSRILLEKFELFRKIREA
jgi:hypothetical protein